MSQVLLHETGLTRYRHWKDSIGQIDTTEIEGSDRDYDSYVSSQSGSSDEGTQQEGKRRRCPPRKDAEFTEGSGLSDSLSQSQQKTQTVQTPVDIIPSQVGDTTTSKSLLPGQRTKTPAEKKELTYVYIKNMLANMHADIKVWPGFIYIYKIYIINPWWVQS